VWISAYVEEHVVMVHIESQTEAYFDRVFWLKGPMI